MQISNWWPNKTKRSEIFLACRIFIKCILMDEFQLPPSCFLPHSSSPFLIHYSTLQAKKCSLVSLFTVRSVPLAVNNLEIKLNSIFWKYINKFWQRIRIWKNAIISLALGFNVFFLSFFEVKLKCGTNADFRIDFNISKYRLTHMPRSGFYII